MRTELYFGRSTPETLKASVRAEFFDRGVPIDHEGDVAIKAIDILGLRVDAAFILGTVVGGVLWDVEKAALVRGINALRSVWASSGTVVIDTQSRPEAVPPTVYFVPDGEQGDRALAAIDADYMTAPPGSRMWQPGAGWVSEFVGL